MGSIRVGFFDDFKGADTLLIDVDAEGLCGHPKLVRRSRQVHLRLA
jgi:hypothetical protein